MKNKHFILIGNGDHRNRGCEAITIGTITILEKIFGSDISVVNRPISEEGVSPPSSVDNSLIHELLYDPYLLPKKFSILWWVRRICLEIPTLTKILARIDAVRTLSKRVGKECVVLSLGGDNYTLDYSIPYTFIEHGKFAKKHGSAFFIWGATVGPFDKNPAFSRIFMQHLKTDVRGIFAREGRTVNYLKSNDIEHVFAMTDPAFVMTPQIVSTERLGFELPKEAIGVNLSPIMRTYSHGGNYEDWLHNAIEILGSLRNQFKCPIVLIPHVTIGTANNDYYFMQECLNKLQDRTGFYIIDDRLNAQETKWVISQMKCIIASRTHATIAAFSTCTPTVSLAYSVKAMGINEDLFGHAEYVVKPSELNSATVINVTERVLEDSDRIKSLLDKNMPKIVEKAFEAGRKMKYLLNALPV